MFNKKEFKRKNKIAHRMGQRIRIARRIKEVRCLPNGRNKEDAIFSLLQIAGNYSKI